MEENKDNTEDPTAFNKALNEFFRGLDQSNGYELKCYYDMTPIIELALACRDLYWYEKLWNWIKSWKKQNQPK